VYIQGRGHVTSILAVQMSKCPCVTDRISKYRNYSYSDCYDHWWFQSCTSKQAAKTCNVGVNTKIVTLEHSMSVLVAMPSSLSSSSSLVHM
jgi:hypothetical protein